VTDVAVAVETVSAVPLTVTVGLVAQLPTAVAHNPDPAIVSVDGVPSAE